MIVWLGGAFVEEAAARIDPADRGFTLADGVFDTMLAEDGTPRDAAAHFARLARHARVIDLDIPVDEQTLPAIAATLLEKNGFTTGRHAIRTTLTRGPGARGLALPELPRPTLLMRATPAAPLPDTPVTLTVAATTRRNEHSPLSRIKSLAYGDNIIALMEAKARGLDDALLLNTAGHLTCATASNVFIVERGRLITPPLADGVLDGITRRAMIEKDGAIEESITLTRLQDADRVILANSVAGIRTGILIEA